MPFIGGLYVPPGPPIFPPNPGDVIDSSYYTQLITDISNALSVTLLRDGSVGLSGDLNANIHGVKGLISGSAASPAIRFNTDATTGLYLDGTGKLCLSVGGVKQFEITANTVKYRAGASVAVPYAATINFDGDAGFNYNTTLTGNVLFGDFVNPNIGSQGVARITQDATGGRTATFSSKWKFPDISPTLSTPGGSVDLLSYYIFDANTYYATLTPNFV